MGPIAWLYLIPIWGVPTLAIAEEQGTGQGLMTSIDAIFASYVAVIFKVLFFSIGGFPLIVLWLIGGGVFFTLRMNFINLRAFRHAIDVAIGKYDDPEETGEVSHFQALATALSATVGLGNIAGSAIAVSVGGPGAIFWMTIGAILGMTSKFVECTLGQKYRIVKPDGTIAGGPMYYLSRGLASIGQESLGKVLAILFSVFCLGGAFGGANMFQANQSYGVVKTVLPFLPNWLYGLMLMTLVGLVIIGGIRRIAQVASTIVPAMCALFILMSLFILLTNFTAIPGAIGTIISEAFMPQAVEGGIIGTIVQGFRRSAFSNEAGLGAAAIAHSATKTSEPVREGIVALLEPFIDTVVICNINALVLVITGAYNNRDFEALRAAQKGAELTAAALGSVISWFPILLAIAIFLFAFSTIISWSYYGESSWEYLFGAGSLMFYKVLFLIAIFIGSVTKPTTVINFSDALIIAAAFPNLLGAYFLSGQVAADLKDYMGRLNSGEFRMGKLRMEN